LALTGFHYSGVEQRMRFAAKEGHHFWSNGYAWGTCEQKSSKSGTTVKLDVLGGTLHLKQFALGDGAAVEIQDAKPFGAGESITLKV